MAKMLGHRSGLCLCWGDRSLGVKASSHLLSSGCPAAMSHGVVGRTFAGSEVMPRVPKPTPPPQHAALGGTPLSPVAVGTEPAQADMTVVFLLPWAFWVTIPFPCPFPSHLHPNSHERAALVALLTPGWRRPGLITGMPGMGGEALLSAN